tara:strand:+ start:89 stop:322 length:234 start_codon:yes stop_codon:yes gene_type:complete
MTKIVIEVKKATEGQVKSLLADLAMSIEPWKRYIHYKIKNGNKVYKRQAPSMTAQEYSKKKKLQAPSDKLDKWSILG